MPAIFPKELSISQQAEEAVHTGDTATLRQLFSEHRSALNASSLLCEAIDGRHTNSNGYSELNPKVSPDVVQFLIDHGANVNGRGFEHQLLGQLMCRYIPYFGNHRSGGTFPAYRTPSPKAVIDIAQRMIDAGADVRHAGQNPKLDAMGMAYATHNVDIIRFMEHVYKQKGINVSVEEKLEAFNAADGVNGIEYPQKIADLIAVLKHLQNQLTPDTELAYPCCNALSIGTHPTQWDPCYNREAATPEDIAAYEGSENRAYDHIALKLSSMLAALPVKDNEKVEESRGHLVERRQKAAQPNSLYYYQYSWREPDAEFFARQDYLAQTKAQLTELPGHKNRFRLMNSEEEYAFERVAAIAYKMAQGINPHIPHTPSELMTSLLKNEKEDWSKIFAGLPKHAQAMATTAKDAFTGITRALVLPEMLRRLKAKGIRPNSVDTAKLEDAVMPEVAESLIQTRTLKTMLELGDAWHEQLSRIESVRKVPRTGTWPKLAEDFKAQNGVAIHFITSAEEVAAHAEKMRPCCAADYVEEFKAGRLHVASVADADGTLLSTLGLKRDKENPEKILKVTENLGPRNRNLDTDSPAHIAVDEFLEKVRADEKVPDKIRINFAGLDIEHKKRAMVRNNSYIDLIGHDPFAEDAAMYEKKYLEAYASIRLRTGAKAPFIPGHGKTDGDYMPQHFLQDNHLNEVIDNCVNNRAFQRSITKQGIGIT